MDVSKDEEDKSEGTKRLLFGGNGKLEKEESEAGESKMLLELPTCPKKQNLPNKPPEGPKPRRWSGGDENVWHLESETISEGNAGTPGLCSATGVTRVGKRGCTWSRKL